MFGQPSLWHSSYDIWSTSRTLNLPLQKFSGSINEGVGDGGQETPGKATQEVPGHTGLCGKRGSQLMPRPLKFEKGTPTLGINFSVFRACCKKSALFEVPKALTWLQQ